MAFIKMSINGDVQLSRNLRVLANDLKELKPFYKEAVEIVKKRSDDVFKTEGKNIKKSNKWEWLSSTTKTARANRWGYYKKTPNKPKAMRWTGNLQDNTTEIATKAFWLFKFNASYAIYHQKGGKTLPKRALIDLDNTTNAKITKALQKLIYKQIWIFNRQA